MRFRLVPVDAAFFELFSESARNVAEGARRLRTALDDPAAIVEGHARVIECERRGDEITRALLKRLDTSFVTPFDREDIHALAEELDDVVDDIHAVSALLQVVGVTEILPEIKEQADLLVQMAEANVELVDRLEKMRGAREYLDLIDRLESDGDAVRRRTLARLFSGEMPALDVIKWKDVTEAMEAAINTLEDISDIVEAIVLKHA